MIKVVSMHPSLHISHGGDSVMTSVSFGKQAAIDRGGFLERQANRLVHAACCTVNGIIERVGKYQRAKGRL